MTLPPSTPAAQASALPLFAAATASLAACVACLHFSSVWGWMLLFGQTAGHDRHRGWAGADGHAPGLARRGRADPRRDRLAARRRGVESLVPTPDTGRMTARHRSLCGRTRPAMARIASARALLDSLQEQVCSDQRFDQKDTQQNQSGQRWSQKPGPTNGHLLF
jgi:hypothetical protein